MQGNIGNKSFDHLSFYFTLIRCCWPLFLSPSPASQTPLWPQRLSSWWWNCCLLTESPIFLVGWRWRFAGNQGISMMMASSCRVRLIGHQLFLGCQKKGEKTGFPRSTKRSRTRPVFQSRLLLLTRPKALQQLLQPFPAATTISHSQFTESLKISKNQDGCLTKY